MRKKKEEKTTKVFLVKSFNDMKEICMHIKENYIVIVNVNNVHHKTRYIDFISGFTYAYNGKREKIEDNIFSFQIM